MLLLIQESKSRRFLTKFGLIPSNVFFRLGSAQSKLGVPGNIFMNRSNFLKMWYEILKKLDICPSNEPLAWIGPNLGKKTHC